MKILYVVHQFFPRYYTGTERFVLNLASQMQKMGNRVRVVTYGITENEGFNKEFEGFLIKKYIYKGLEILSTRHKIIPDDISFAISYQIPDFLLYEIFQEEFDIIHFAHPMRLAPIFAHAFDLGIPIVLTLTDFWLMCPRGIGVTADNELCLNPEDGNRCVKKCYGERWKEKILKRYKESEEIVKKSNAVVSPTYFLASIIQKTYGRKDIKVIKHGINYLNIIPNTKLKQKGDKVVLGYIGTVLPHKGIHIAIEALKLVKATNIELRIYGHHFHAKEYFNELLKIAEKDSRIKFIGEYKDEELNIIMNEVDCTIQPSIWWENSPLTILTSLAYKVPVITTNIGGAAELVKNGINGFNFEIGNAESLASVLEMIATDPTILNVVKERIVRPPRIEEEAFEYEKLYRTLLGT